MSTNIEIVVLADNTAAEPEMTVEHGLSFWVTAGPRHILFDTGQGLALAGNAVRAGIDLGQTDSIVLSHGHYDHTGGLKHVLGQAISPRIFMHPDATQSRFSRQVTPPHKPIGMRTEVADLLAARVADIVYTTKPTQVSKGMWATGPIPRLTPFEDTGGPFFLDPDCCIEDPLTDDQALWMETGEGVVVLLGCAHSGVVNTLDYIAALTGAAEFHAVLGGMHLLNATQQRLAATCQAFKRYAVRLIAPCHCTGDKASALIAEQFPLQYVHAGAGSTFGSTLGD